MTLLESEIDALEFVLSQYSLVVSRVTGRIETRSSS